MHVGVDVIEEKRVRSGEIEILLEINVKRGAHSDGQIGVPIQQLLKRVKCSLDEDGDWDMDISGPELAEAELES